MPRINLNKEVRCRSSIAIYIENGEIFRRRAFFRKYIELYYIKKFTVTLFHNISNNLVRYGKIRNIGQ